MSETHWKGSGHYTTDSGNTIYFSGNDTESRNEVAFLLPRSTAKAVLGYNAVRIITIKIKSQPFNVNVIQAYAPTSDSSDEAIEAFYKQLNATINELPKNEILVVTGDMNAKIGKTKDIDEQLKGIIGSFGLGTRNERGERMLQFCQEQNLTIANTLFAHHKRCLYTWTSPGDRYRNQIDYIMVRSRWKSSVVNCKTYPGAVCGSDHNLLLRKFRLRLKRIYHQCNRINMTETAKRQFQEEIQNKLEAEKHDIMNKQDPD
ncbi:craniofacial development protein 2-like [Anthonomus grandis grandis]|uniref:craniofacial development protein 2-like n=1 Tax=Anthonomus grandis grandis TaxID=2921223 RepID=UPI0021650852|nr:craniofacial development protein 2-like [Anthonomus grandis grandis]